MQRHLYPNSTILKTTFQYVKFPDADRCPTSKPVVGALLSVIRF